MNVIDKHKESIDVENARLRKELSTSVGALDEKVYNSVEELRTATNDNFNAVKICLDDRDRQHNEVTSRFDRRLEAIDLKLTNMGRPTVKTVQGAQAFDLNPDRVGAQQVIGSNNDLRSPYDRHVTLRKCTGSAFSLNGNGEPFGRDVGRSSHDQGLPVASNATSDYGMPLYGQESPSFSFNPVGSGGGSKATTEHGAGYVQVTLVEAESTLVMVLNVTKNE
ncbi:hypothetical protein Pmar_PMAR029063 [Perkinsus marinus ATCC 50983]|uniref:Uncharacterized protein n=1 Tax=Perkinsus marinus (strain ATCC 50983 / TXsc) TaxID=423536 RepID=C5L5M3_PERM5|nr:hypothetical protein Pmar_PMAR029063 [Perkinsus marinus ATCC 50983]EER07970.1 hypothetical protein Pmar_PMAR029063 [Perkinsus marinus ATCC 50983]|eukprot:XP_002776154.1 hypothetical protein Pmar_PMAR029063 [Perkinsus marinus ATCC 50983]